MKKTSIFIATVIVCCVFLGIGFYAGWASKSITTKSTPAEVITTTEKVEESLFDKQAKCNSLYEVYKDKLSYANTNTSSLEELSVSYSPSLDNCIASWIVNYKRGDSTTYFFNIVNASRGDQPIYQCYGNPLDPNDECNLKKWRGRIYEYTYSDVLDEIY